MTNLFSTRRTVPKPNPLFFPSFLAFLDLQAKQPCFVYAGSALPLDPICIISQPDQAGHLARKGGGFPQGTRTGPRKVYQSRTFAIGQLEMRTLEPKSMG